MRPSGLRAVHRATVPAWAHVPVPVLRPEHPGGGLFGTLQGGQAGRVRGQGPPPDLRDLLQDAGRLSGRGGLRRVPHAAGGRHRQAREPRVPGRAAGDLASHRPVPGAERRADPPGAARAAAEEVPEDLEHHRGGGPLLRRRERGVGRAPGAGRVGPPPPGAVPRPPRRAPRRRPRGCPAGARGRRRGLALRAPAAARRARTGGYRPADERRGPVPRRVLEEGEVLLFL
mmetsp:Transcript_76026/g.234678  ORF Transcript_76026/g.234678 Transcript_76026/m.234678 type:complete len:229 (-) Transcript_76026:402-1088(-)